MTRRQTQADHSYGLEPLPSHITEKTVEQAIAFVGYTDAENYYGYDPKTVMDVQSAIDRENSCDPAEMRAIQKRDELIRAAAEEEMIFLNGYNMEMIVALMEHSKRIPALAKILSRYEYGCDMAEKMHKAARAGRDPIEILGLHRLSNTPMSARLGPSI